MLTRLIEVSFPDADHTRKVRWLNRLLLSFIVIAVLWGLTSLFTIPLSSFAHLFNLLLVGLLAVLYLLNRRGLVTPALLGLLTLMVGAMVQQSLAQQDLAVLVYPALFVLAIVTTGIFLSWWAVLGTVLGVSLLTVWYFQFSDAPGVVIYRAQESRAITFLMVTFLILFVCAGALSWLSSRLIAENLGDLRRRAADLEVAYRELAEQNEREHALGSNIGTLATQLSAVSTRQVQGVATQAHVIAQVGAAVNELHAAANQITTTTHQVREVAAAALDSVMNAQTLVAHSREVVERNRAQVQSVIERMAALDQLTERITNFVNGIRELSDETQLLSLNATIEAAGAGSLGRRFGVVAEEVQLLARRSDAFVAQIQHALAELRQAGQVALTTTESGLGIADQVQQVADAVNTAQAQVAAAVEETHALVQQIAMAASQQTTATEQVTQTMHQLAADASTTSQETRALEAVSRELLRAAEALTSAMARLNPARVV